MIRGISRLARNTAGVAAMEFSLVFGTAVLPTSLAIVEFARILWTRQMVLEVADLTARCSAMGGSLCNSPNTVTSFATTAASQAGFSLPSGAVVTETKATTCNGASNSYYDKIQVTYPYSRLVPSFVTYIAPLPSTLSVSVCYAS